MNESINTKKETFIHRIDEQYSTTKKILDIQLVEYQKLIRKYEASIEVRTLIINLLKRQNHNLVNQRNVILNCNAQIKKYSQILESVYR